MAVYLLHFEKKIAHAHHYIGFTKNGVDERIACHRTGHGARLVAEFVAHGMDFVVARVWPKGTRTFERQLKRRKNAPRLCPHCKEAKTS